METQPQAPTRGTGFFEKIKNPSKFSKPQLLIFVLAFALIGYLIFRSFAAAPLVASIEAEQMTPSGGTTTAAVSSGFMTSLTNNSSVTTPYLWTFNPGVATTAGYFFANGKLLKKITGPGPYVLRLNSGMLKNGTNKLGHAWDTTAGQHQSPPSAYSEKINNVAGSGFVTTLTNNMTINAPYIWAFDPGVNTTAGYFWHSNTLITKITGPRPYVYVIEPGALGTGVQNLGHGWDLASDGSHHTPPSSYNVTIGSSTSATAPNSTVINDSTASGGQAVKYGAGVTLSGSFNLPSSAASLTVMAHGEQCNSAWPQMTVKVDGQTVINTTVSSTSWNGYNANLTLNSGTHTLTITNSGTGCANLFADVTNFFGPNTVTPAPTIALSASPTSVTAGQSSTLTWTSTNASSCIASGAWSGTKATSGSASTGAVNQDSTYTLTCTGVGGSTTASTTVTVAAAGSTDFVSASGWARPAPATPTAASGSGWRLVPFSTKAGLDSAISNMQPHDYIYYNGTGILTISNSSSNSYVIVNKNPSGRVVIDLGTSKSIWDSSTVSGNYVKFVFAGTGDFNALWLNSDSNLTIFGGDFSTSTNGNGILINAPSHDITLDGTYLHSIGESGISVRGSTSSGSASNVYNLSIRAEVAGFCMNPVYDPHADKGTGCHALILHGNSGGIYNSTFAIYGHDPIAPGGKSLTGVVYPEGTGGSVIEQGNDTAANYNGDTMYALGKNLLMKPGYGTNPGSTGVQTGGNVFDLWGNVKLNGNVIGWAEGSNTTGSIINTDNGSWFPGSPALTVLHGRHYNTNQYTGGSNIPQPYPTTTRSGTPLGIIYQDCL